MFTEFYFSGFEPDEQLRGEANQILNELTFLAPQGAVAISRLEKQDNLYRCAINIHSKRGPFLGVTVHQDPQEALNRARHTLIKKLNRLRSQQKKRDFSDFDPDPMVSVA